MNELPQSLSDLTPAEVVAFRQRAKTDKLFLATAVLGYDFQADVHQELFDQFIQYDGLKPWSKQAAKVKRLILWPRGHFKSSAVVVDVIQAILNFPDIRVLLMQGSVKTTKRLMKEIAAHFLGEASGSRLADLFPEFCGNKKTLALTAESFTVPARKRKQLQQATVTVASPKSVKTGQHYDIGFFDDLVNDQNYRSETLLEKVREDYTMALPLLDPPFYCVVTGTRYAHGDLYEWIAKQAAVSGEWVVSIKTCWTDDGKDVRFPKRETRDGRFVGFTREMLLTIKATDPAMYASQYMLQPASTAHQTFTEAVLDARVIPASNAPESMSKPLMFVDLASGGSDRSDDSVILIMQTDHLGKMYATFCRGGQWDTSELAAQIIDAVMRREVNERPAMIYFEKSAAGGIFVDHLRLICQTKGITLPLDFLPADTRADAKAIRVQALLSYLKLGRLLFFAGLEAWEKMKDQFVKWTGRKGQHDDYPDTIALAAQYFSKNTVAVKPLSAERYPFLKIMELQGTDISAIPQTHEPVSYENDMGDSFSF